MSYNTTSGLSGLTLKPLGLVRDRLEMEMAPSVLNSWMYDWMKT